MFKVTGVSRCKGSYKVRFANDMARVKVLVKTGHDNIELFEMPAAVDKLGCVNFLKTTELYNRPEFKEAIDAADVKYNSSSTITVKSIKPSAKVKSSRPSLDAIKARAVKSETTEITTEVSNT